MHPHQLAELNVPLRRGRRVTDEHGPPAGGSKAVTRDLTPLAKAPELLHAPDRTHEDPGQGLSHGEAGDRTCHQRIGEGDRLRVQDVHGVGCKRTQEELTEHTSVLNVQPLAAGDKDSEVPRTRQPGGGEEEVDVQPGQGAGVQPPGPGGLGQPRLPPRCDAVVADERGVADEERGAIDRVEPELAVVAQYHLDTLGQAHDMGTGPSHERGQRVNVAGDDVRPGEHRRRCEREPPRAAAGIHDAHRPAVVSRPRRHRLNNRRRRVGLPERPPALGGHHLTVGVTERVATGQDQVPGRGHHVLGRARARRGQVLLLGTEAVSALGPVQEPQAERGKVRTPGAGSVRSGHRASLKPHRRRSSSRYGHGSRPGQVCRALVPNYTARARALTPPGLDLAGRY